MPLTKAQHAINVSKSTGAVTAAGKARSARNAVKHGLSSRKPPLLLNESRDEYDRTLKRLQEQYSPQGELEMLCLEQMAQLAFKQRRLWQFEAASTNVTMLESQLSALTISYPMIGARAVDYDFGTTATAQDELVFLKELLSAERSELEQFSLQYGTRFVPPDATDQAEHIGMKCYQSANNLIELDALHAAVRDRITYIEFVLEQQGAIQEQLQQAKRDRLVVHVPTIEQCDRYQRSISRELDRVIDRLQLLQRDRQTIDVQAV